MKLTVFKMMALVSLLSLVPLGLATPTANTKIDPFSIANKLVTHVPINSSSKSLTEPEGQQLQIHVDTCVGINYQEPCVLDTVVSPNDCLVLTGRIENNIGSLRFYGDVYCQIYTAEGECEGTPRTLYAASPDLGVDGRNAKAFRCNRRSKIAYANDPFAFVPVNEQYNSIQRPEERQLPGHIDLCANTNYREPCLRNAAFAPEQCYIPVGFVNDIGSILFSGNMFCALYTDEGACAGVPTIIREPTPDLGAVGKHIKSIQCARADKFATGSTTINHTIESTDVIEARQLPGLLDLCTGTNYDGRCALNNPFPAHGCVGLGGVLYKNLGSIRFSGNMWCSIFPGDGCTGHNKVVYASTPDLGADGRNAVCFMCDRQN